MNWSTVYSVPPAQYSLTDYPIAAAQLADRQALLSHVHQLTEQLHAMTHVLAERSSHIAELARSNDSLNLSLHAILRIQCDANDDRSDSEADSDDDDGMRLELLELRRWRQAFSTLQARGLVNRVEELTAENLRLRQQLEACVCTRP